MESAPDTTNICYMDEYRKAKWLAELQRAREAGAVAVFSVVQPSLAEVLPFRLRLPEQRMPDGAA